MRLFVDTSAFLAIEDKDDRNYESASRFRNDILHGHTPYRLLYTTNYVFDETVTLIRKQLGHKAASTFGEAIRDSKVVNMLWISQEIDAEAWSIFKKYKDKDFSYTDCTSFATMEAEGINEIFAYDNHFSQYGFQAVP